MGEEAKQEEAKVAEAKPEEKKEEKKKEEEKKEEEKVEEKKEEEAKPSPPPPIVLHVDLHCVGCSKKIERAILKYKGVEGVEVDMEKNQVTVKGIVDPQALCTRIQKKTLRRAKVLSPPLPPPEGDSTKSQVVQSQVSAITTVELHVNMHCEACAQQLQKKILKMRGVQTAATNLTASKVTVTGTVSGEKLVEYIHRRTGKLATIIPPPPPKEEEKKEEPEKKPEGDTPPPEEKKEEKAAEEKKEETAAKADEKAPQEGNAEADKKDGDGAGSGKEEKGEGEEPKKDVVVTNPVFNEEDMIKRMMYWNGGFISQEEMARRMMMMHWMPMPVYMIEPPLPPPPPPQLFSDENPNACCIS